MHLYNLHIKVYDSDRWNPNYPRLTLYMGNYTQLLWVFGHIKRDDSIISVKKSGAAESNNKLQQNMGPSIAYYYYMGTVTI